MRRRVPLASLVVLATVALSAAAHGQTGGLPAGEIEKLVAPIALYPDVLVSQILPAATFPTDVVLAARWCKAHPDLAGLDAQPWDLSVISICRYPQVLARLDEDLDWTNALGAAFLAQQPDVLAAIQRLRAAAQSAGVLQSTPQQTVVVEQEVIRIVPAEKEVVYVPQYDPQVVYVAVDDDDDDYDSVSVGYAATASAISFGAGLALGAWLDNDCDWHGGVVVGCRPGYWGGYPHRGVVAWDDDWIAARGPRRGVVAGEHGGAYVGPRGAAVWGENGRGAAWRRPTTYGAPGYTGRYSGYQNYSGNRRNVMAGNQVNVNNVNIDRGDRTAVNSSRNRAAISGGSQARPADGNRSAAVSRDRASADRDRTPAPDRAQAQRTQRDSRSSSANRSSSFSDRRSASQVQRSSSRGAASRGSASRGGRGGRGGRR